MKIFLVIAVTLFMSMSCFARIGETEEQCEKRYDDSDGGHRFARGGDDFTIAYEKAGITTTCAFYYPIDDNVPGNISALTPQTDLKACKGTLRIGGVWNNYRYSTPTVCYKINFFEKGSKTNAAIKAAIPDLLKANGGILSWREVEDGVRWECVNKKLVAVFDPERGLTIVDISCKPYCYISESTPRAKAKVLKSF